jgi:glucan phosphoethanolaminetransferase (alkaline phosphatase superfamily)
MNQLIQRFYNHITIAKVVCLALLFSPFWGIRWWFSIDPDHWAVGGHDNPATMTGALQIWINYLLKSMPAAIVYTSVYLSAILGFAVVTFIRPWVIRVPLMLVMLIGWAFELSILDVSGTTSNPALLWILWEEFGFAPQAIAGYAPYIARDCAAVAILGLVLCAPPVRRFSVSGIFGLLPIVASALVAGSIVYTKQGTQVFPIPIGTFSNLAIVLLTKSPGSLGRSMDPAQLHSVLKNADAQIEGKVNPIFNKIVMIMDESVRGDYLSLNDATYNTTPFLKTIDNLVNFGVAISSGNCSYISRTVFRFGMRQSDLPNGWRQGLSRPTIWQFAHRAGYETVHIDASVHNELSPAEKTLVDSNITVFEKPGYLRDPKLVSKILETLKDEKPAFIYVNKYGVHFPYSNKYPPDRHPFPAPVLNVSDHQSLTIGRYMSALLGGFLRPSETDRTPDQEVDHYLNAITWSVDEFFRRLLPAVDLSKTLIIYTSDHGQSFLPGRLTHCSTTLNAPRSQAYVPLFAITSMPEFERGIKKGLAGNFGQFSHFEVFPTLLLAMGYDDDFVKRIYGPSLMDTPSQDRKFMIGSPDVDPMMLSADR